MRASALAYRERKAWNGLSAKLQRPEKRDKLGLLRVSEPPIVIDYQLGLAGMAQDRAAEAQRLSIMHELVVCAQAPKRGVRNLFRVVPPPFCTMPSPVPTLCSRKSLNGS